MYELIIIRRWVEWVACLVLEGRLDLFIFCFTKAGIVIDTLCVHSVRVGLTVGVVDYIDWWLSVLQVEQYRNAGDHQPQKTDISRHFIRPIFPCPIALDRGIGRDECM